MRVVSVHLQTTGVAALRARYRKEHDREAPVEALLGEVERNSRSGPGRSMNWNS